MCREITYGGRPSRIPRAAAGVIRARTLSYILSVTDADPRPIGRWAHRVGRRAEEAYVTAAEKIAQQVRAKALVEGRREMVRKQLKRRFGELPEHVERRLRYADAEQLDGWALKLLDAPSLEDVFA